MAEHAPDEIDKRILTLAYLAATRVGFEVRVVETPDGWELHDDKRELGMQLAPIIWQAGQFPPEQWPDIVDAFFADAARLLDDPELLGDPPSTFEQEELRAQLYTQLIAPRTGSEWSYRRRLAPGLQLVLGLRYPDRTETLTTDDITQLRIPVATLFRWGQENTDAIPDAETVALGHGVQLARAESPFFAAQVANFPTLLHDVIGPAPVGVAFVVPDPQSICYRVLSRADYASEVAQFQTTVKHRSASPEFGRDNSGLSERYYYWSPDDSISVLLEETIRDGQSYTRVNLPGRYFEP